MHLRMGIRAKLLGTVGLVTAMLVIVAGVGLYQIRAANASAHELYQQNTLGILYANQTLWNMIASAREEKSAYLTADAAKRNELIQKSRAEMDAALKAGKDYEGTHASIDERAQWDATMSTVMRVIDQRKHALDLLAAGQQEEALRLSTAMGNDITVMNKALADVVAINEQLAADAVNAIGVAASDADMIMIVVTVVAIAIGLGIAFWLARDMSNRANAILTRLQSLQQHCLADLKTGMAALANGDLTSGVTPVTPKIPASNGDELGQAISATNGIIDAMVATIGAYNDSRSSLSIIFHNVRRDADTVLGVADQLNESSGQMAEATNQIATAINEVTSSSMSLASLAQQSAREIEQVAAGSEEVAAAAQSNADPATVSRTEATQMGERIGMVAAASEEVASAAADSKTAALQGQQAVEQAVTSMEAIAKAVEHASQTVDQLGE